MLLRKAGHSSSVCGTLRTVLTQQAYKEGDGKRTPRNVWSRPGAHPQGPHGIYLAALPPWKINQSLTFF